MPLEEKVVHIVQNTACVIRIGAISFELLYAIPDT